MTATTLADKLLAIHRSLDAARIPHAFGGAVALAYCTGEPRGTIDIDLNIFVAASEAPRVFTDLPSGVRTVDDDCVTAARDGQVRVFWDATPVDLFFDYHHFHEEVAGRIRTVPFAGDVIPVLSCEDLLVFKTLFSRTKDWADIEAMVATEAVDCPVACERVADLLGPDHPSYRRLLDTLQAARGDGGGGGQPKRPLM